MIFDGDKITTVKKVELLIEYIFEKFQLKWFTLKIQFLFYFFLPQLQRNLWCYVPSDVQIYDVISFGFLSNLQVIVIVRMYRKFSEWHSMYVEN